MNLLICPYMKFKDADQVDEYQVRKPLCFKSTDTVLIIELVVFFQAVTVP